LLYVSKITYYFFLKKIQSIFSRVRLLYGATPIEDIIGYNQIVRSITEWTNTSGENTITQQSISEGIGGYTVGRAGQLSSFATDIDAALVTCNANTPGLVNVRQAFIHGISTQNRNQNNRLTAPVGMGFGTVPNGSLANAGLPITPASGRNDLVTTTNPRRRYQIQFALGLFNQPKLIPTKFMASQLSIEITLANAAECIYIPPLTTLLNGNPTYQVTNVNLIPEILEFDASYGKNKITKMKCF
jgi:hypothetical protein